MLVNSGLRGTAVSHQFDARCSCSLVRFPRSGTGLAAERLQRQGTLHVYVILANSKGQTFTVSLNALKIKKPIHCHQIDYQTKALCLTQACSNSNGQPYPCGIVSMNALKDHTGTKPIHCEVKTRDQYGRNVAACKIMAGRYSEDMGDWLVANGYAVAYR